MEIVFKIENIEEYGYLIAFCIENDISVFRSYWDDREKLNRCYSISWKDKILYYSNCEYYIREKQTIYKPIFSFDKYGKVKIDKEKATSYQCSYFT